MKPPVMTPERTMQLLLEKSQRKEGVPLRASFVHGGTSRRKAEPGPLADFVHKHDSTALDLYLLALTVATSAPFEVRYPAATWARALRISDLSAISRAWARIEERRLISRVRQGRLAKITILKESGKGGAYTHPSRGVKPDPYGKLPLAYWRDQYFRSLNLPAKSMLLITLCWHGPLTLPSEHAEEWYGISADTCERGLGMLERVGIVAKSKTWRESLHSPTGQSQVNVYTLKGAFAQRRKEGRPKLAIVG